MSIWVLFRMVATMVSAEQENSNGTKKLANKNVLAPAGSFSNLSLEADSFNKKSGSNHFSSFRKHQEQIKKLMQETEQQFNKNIETDEAEDNKEWDVIGIVDEENHKEIMAQRASGNKIEKLYKKAVKDKNGGSRVFSFSSFSSSSSNRPNARRNN